MKKITLIISIITLASCSMIPKVDPVEVTRIQKTAPIFHPPLPRELALLDVDWEVLTPEIMAQYLQDLENGDAPAKAYYALTTKEYENLSINMAEFKRYLENILAINKYYRDLDKNLSNED